MGTNRKSSNFLVQGSILAAASIIGRIIGLLYRIPLTNIIGDEGMGYYSNAFAIYNVALILSSYSLPLAVSKLVAARVVRKEYRNSYRIFLCAMGFALMTGIIATLAVFFGADFLAVTLYNAEPMAIPLKVLAPTIFVFAVMGVLRGYFQGKNTMLPTSISQILEQIINAIVSIAAAYYLMKAHSASVNIAGYGAAGSTFGTFAGAAVSLLFLLFIFTLYKPIIKRQLRKDTGNSKESWRQIFGLLLITIVPVILSQTVYQVSSVIDGSLFGHIMEEKGLDTEARNTLWGIYANKYNTLINIPVSIASAMAVAIIPSIVASRADGRNLEVNNKIQQAVKLNMIIAIPSAVGMGVLASPILKLLFGDGSAMPANLLRLGSVAIVFFALSTITNAVLQGINRMRVPVIHSAISLVVHIALVFVLLKVFNLGTYGMVIGNVTFALLVCILNWISVGRHLNYKQEVFRTFIIPTSCSVFMGVFAFLTYEGVYLLVHRNSISTLAAILVAVAVYFCSLLLFKGVTRNELSDMPLGRTLVRVANKLHLL